MNAAERRLLEHGVPGYQPPRSFAEVDAESERVRHLIDAFKRRNRAQQELDALVDAQLLLGIETL